MFIKVNLYMLMTKSTLGLAKLFHEVSAYFNNVNTFWLSKAQAELNKIKEENYIK